MGPLAALSSKRAAALLQRRQRTGGAFERIGFSLRLSAATLATLGPCAAHAMNSVELWWIVKALELWGPCLRGQCLVCFCDNAAAVCGCLSGYSSSVYVAKLVGAIHELLCQFNIVCWFEWLHTQSNPTDDASREGGEQSLRRMGAQVQTVSAHLTSYLSRYYPT